MILFSSEIFVVLLLWLRHLLVTLLTTIVFKSSSGMANTNIRNIPFDMKKNDKNQEM